MQTKNLARGVLAVVLGLIGVFIFLKNSAGSFGGDEALMFFVGDHKLYAPIFLKAVRSMTAGMPYGFWEYGVYLRILKLLPFNTVMEHLEAIGRLPLTIDFAVIAVSIWGLVWTLTRSMFWVGMITVFLWALSPLSTLLALELRFHSPAMVYIALSWLAFALFETQPGRRRSIFWLITAGLSSWTHVFGIYNTGIQVMCHGLIRWRSGTLKTGRRAALALCVSVGTAAAFFKLLMANPNAEPSPPITRAMVFQAIGSVDHVLPPSGVLWVLVFVVSSVLFVRAAKSRRDAQERAFVALFGLSQATMIFLLGLRVAQFHWSAPSNHPRYMMAGLVPFIAALSYILGRVWNPLWERRLLLLGVAVWVIAAGAFLRTATIPGPSKNQWTDLRAQMLAIQGYGKATTVMGLRPSPDHSLQKLLKSEGDVGHVWQIYGKGPFAVAPLTEYWVNSYGGLADLPCEARLRYPAARPESERLILDFCDAQHFVARELR